MGNFSSSYSCKFFFKFYALAEDLFLQMYSMHNKYSLELLALRNGINKMYTGSGEQSIGSVGG